VPVTALGSGDKTALKSLTHHALQRTPDPTEPFPSTWQEGDPKGWTTLPVTALGSWERTVLRGHRRDTPLDREHWALKKRNEAYNLLEHQFLVEHARFFRTLTCVYCQKQKLFVSHWSDPGFLTTMLYRLHHTNLPRIGFDDESKLVVACRGCNHVPAREIYIKKEQKPMTFWEWMRRLIVFSARILTRMVFILARFLHSCSVFIEKRLPEM
jgi:hypothetical protein